MKIIWLDISIISSCNMMNIKDFQQKKKKRIPNWLMLIFVILLIFVFVNTAFMLFNLNYTLFFFLFHYVILCFFFWFDFFPAKKNFLLIIFFKLVIIIIFWYPISNENVNLIKHTHEMKRINENIMSFNTHTHIHAFEWNEQTRPRM